MRNAKFNKKAIDNSGNVKCTENTELNKKVKTKKEHSC